MNSVPAKFSSEDLVLEGEWLFPEGEGPFPAVVVAHPFPPGGGTMHNSIVESIWQALAGRNIAAFRFNFRGVEGSQGKFAEGIGEYKDVKAAFEHALSAYNIDKRRVGLAGYSFGAMMSAPAAIRDERVKGLALVSAPLSDDQWKKLDGYKNPYLAVIGENDQMVSTDNFRLRMDNPPKPGIYRMLPGADHFLAGYEEEVGEMVAEFFKGVLFSGKY